MMKYNTQNFIPCHAPPSGAAHVNNHKYKYKKEVIFMAQRTANKQAQSNQRSTGNDIAEMHISGILDSVYVGKKYCYADVKVQNADNNYYSIYKVQTPLDYDFPEDGDRFECDCTAKCYQGQISLSIKIV